MYVRVWTGGPVISWANQAPSGEPRGSRGARRAALWGSTLSFSSSSSSPTNQRTALEPLSTNCAQTHTHTNALWHRHLLAENSMSPKIHSHAFQKPSVGHWIYNHSRTQAYSSTSLSRAFNREPSFFLRHSHIHILYSQYDTHTHTHARTHTHPHTHTHTHTHRHVGFYGLQGLSIGVMVFILYKLYVLLPYT